MHSDYYYLWEQGVNEKLIQDLERFAASYPVAEEVKNRVSRPDIPFYGKEILEMSVAALLQGENLLLTGAKATGKNVLAENLAWMFGRPVYNISFHVNTGSEELIGTDTFRDNEVQLRRGSINADPWFRSDNENACLHCDYFDACHFDEDADGWVYKKTLKAPEFWSRLAEGENAPEKGERPCL